MIDRNDSSLHGPLGEKSRYPEQYDPSQLHAIPRVLGRKDIGVNTGALPFQGEDIWNAYELSWLDPKGKPRVAVMEMRVPADSPNIVESKSLKLYLGSFNQTMLDSDQALQQRIAQDVGEVVGASVAIVLHSVARNNVFSLSELPGRCLDDVDIGAVQYHVQAELLTVTESQVEETVHSHLLRSCCPVTGQPDWASVMIQYRGPKIEDASLLKYLISFRNNQEFHEQCVERIFTDISQKCQPEFLLVHARYTRRGGIDINPLRCSEEVEMNNIRMLRQ